MPSFEPAESRRYAFPPLWLLPLLVIGGIVAIVLGSMMLGVVGIPLAGFGIYWLQRKGGRVRPRPRRADALTD